MTQINAPIPSLLAVGAVHHSLIREGTRSRCGIVVESGEPRDIAHLALLVGYGAGAVNPYMVFETMEDMIRQDYFLSGLERETAGEEFSEGGAQGRGQDNGEDGHIHHPELSRRADIRGGRA